MKINFIVEKDIFDNKEIVITRDIVDLEKVKTSYGIVQNENKDDEFLFSRCDDNFVGSIVIAGGKIVEKETDLWFEKGTRINHKENLSLGSVNKENGTIIILLESPHIDEFLSSGESFPAIGYTGNVLNSLFAKLFDEFLDKKLKENKIIIKDNKYNIVLMNAVQFQCSLGMPPCKFRDEIFCELWNSDQIKNDFQKRITAVNPALIFSFCTKGNIKNFRKLNKSLKNDLWDDKRFTMRNMVLNEIRNVLLVGELNNKEIEIVRGMHPSSWYRRKSYREFYLLYNLGSNQDEKQIKS